MAQKLNLILLLLMVSGAVSSCKKEETTIVDYEPITISGKWHLTSYYDGGLLTVQNYPLVLDSTIVTFTDTGRLFIQSSCAPAAGYFLQSQTKEIIITGFSNPLANCSTLAKDMQTRVYSTFPKVYSFSLEDNKLTLRSNFSTTPYLYFNKIE